MTTPAVGDVNGDGISDIIVGSNEKGFDSNTGALHLLHGDGNLHEGGPEHDNWPITISSLDLLPLVGEGVPSAAALADVTDDGRPDIALTGTASPMFMVEGVQPPREPGELVERLFSISTSGRGSLSSEELINSDRPLLNTFANPSLGDMDGDGVPDFVTGGAGLRLAVNLAGGWENQPFNHQVGAWRGTDGNVLSGFPQIIEDYMFFVNPTVADVSGDGYAEAVLGSGGYYVHAWDACGREAEGWPKFVGGWVTSSAALGDVDGDAQLDVAITTRNGYLFVYDTAAPADGTIEWPEFGHDNHNTNNYDSPLSNPGSPGGAPGPIDCGVTSPPTDGGAADGGADGGADDGGSEPIGEPGGGGCDCRVAPPGASPFRGPALLAGIGAILALRRRSRRRSRS
jgi:MYXO-CTERM domain-containing protein